MENEWITMFRQVRQPNPPAASMMDRSALSAVSPEKYQGRQTIEIFRAVLRKLFGMERESGAESEKPFLFILYSETGATIGADLGRTGYLGFSEVVRRGVTRGSKDLPLQIVWIEDVYGVGGDPDGEYVPDGGAVIRFSGIRRDGAALVLVSGNIHRMGSEPRGFEYVVEKKNGFWMVKSSYHLWIS
ncbi:MAG: hypothetical protein JW748_06910 [Anaerolineales bacterium]|nr:hypothetical protein [Anaerolineales bacterium]